MGFRGDCCLSSDLIAEIVAQNGCEFLGVSQLRADELSYQRFKNWLSEDRHGSMKWLEKYGEIRRNPSLLDAKFGWAILLAIPYYSGDRLTVRKKNILVDKNEPRKENLFSDKSRQSSKSCHLENAFSTSELGQSQLLLPKIAQYARYEDYHNFSRKKGASIALDLKKNLDPKGSSEWRAVSDSIPILERAIHERVSPAFIGKNTMLIHPDKGSYFLLMEILTSHPLADTPSVAKTIDRSEAGGCGGCRRCQVYCPTGALDADYQMDAKLCLSYLTIEHRGTIELKFWKHFGKYWYGCDICQLACPYNRKAIAGSPMKSRPDVARDLKEIALMGQNEYEKWFGGTAMTRAKRNGLRRNAIIAMAAIEDPRLDGIMDILLADEDPVVKSTCESVSVFRKEYLYE